MGRRKKLTISKILKTIMKSAKFGYRISRKFNKKLELARRKNSRMLGQKRR